MITSRELRKNLIIFLKSYKIFIILFLIIVLFIISFLNIKKTNFFRKKDNNTIVKTVSNIKTEDVGYNYKLFLKVDNISRRGGILQSIWAKFSNGKEIELYSDEINRYGIKTVGDFFSGFQDKMPDNNRYGFFYVENFNNYKYNLLVFDKEIKEIKQLSEAETKIDNAHIFSPDYRHLAILHTVSDKNSYRIDQPKSKFYVDLIDTATLDVVSRYYIPENYTLFAMNYAEGAGRASWDNIWTSNNEFQVAQFKDTGKPSLWRGDFEKHIISIKDQNQIKDLVLKSTNFLYGFDNNDALYAQGNGGSYNLVKNNFRKDLNLGDVYGNLYFQTSSLNYLFLLDDGAFGGRFLKAILNRGEFILVLSENIPKSLIDVDWDDGSFVVFSPLNDKVFVINSSSSTLIGEVINLNNLKILKHIDLLSKETFDSSIPIERGENFIGDGPTQSLTSHIKWLNDNELEVSVYNTDKKYSNNNFYQLSRVIKIDLHNTK